MLKKIGELDEGGTVSDTLYVTTTDSLPSPIGGWPSAMQNGIFAIVVQTPNPSLARQYPMSQVYLNEWASAPRADDTDGSTQTVHTYGWNTHDAVVLIAKAYDAMKTASGSGTCTCCGGTCSSLRDYVEEVATAANGGVSGRVEVDELTHDRKGSTFEIANLQAGQWVTVGTIDDLGVHMSGVDVVFPGGHDQGSFVDHEDPPLPGGVVATIVIMVLLMVAGAIGAYLNHKEQVYKREHAVELAEKEHQEALEAQRKALEEKKKKLHFPPEWEIDEGDGKPFEGLVEVAMESSEYWDVHERLTKPPDTAFQTPNSDHKGMHDAWITKLFRIQNTDLYTYNDFQKQRLKKSASASGLDDKGEARQTVGWHGTGGFDAANIYNDRQDGASLPSSRFVASSLGWAQVLLSLGLYRLTEALCLVIRVHDAVREQGPVGPRPLLRRGGRLQPFLRDERGEPTSGEGRPAARRVRVHAGVAAAGRCGGDGSRRE